MKKLIIPIHLLVGCILSAQSTSENFIETKTYLESVTTSSSTAKQIGTVQYFDGLGRPKQIVNVKSAPSGKDIVTHIEYDSYGRQVDLWLPTPMTTLNGNIQTSVKSAANTYYSDSNPYSHSNLELSPLDRPLSKLNEGSSWQQNPINFSYGTNATGEVQRYIATFDYNTSQSIITKSTDYTAGELYKNSVTDEDGNQSVEFKNSEGQIILVRKILSATESADTYYIYNNYGHLAYVIAPKGSDLFKNLASSTQLPEAILNSLCYQYKYDRKNRLVEKRLPGKGWEYMVYDKADRLIATQDANLRPDSKWLVTKYDTFGRVIYTGIMPLPNQTREGLQVITNNFVITENKSTQGFTMSGMQIYYTNDLYNQIDTILSVNYYDTYPLGTPTFTPTLTNSGLLTDNLNSDVSTKSLPLASYVKNIEDDNWTKNYTWYDQKGRAIASHSGNHLGGYTKTESELDYSGTAKMVVTKHKRLDSDTERVITENFTYDHQNRIKVHKHKVDNNAEEILAQNNYNDISQVIQKKVGGAILGTGLQTIDYQYNIRGWMTHINDPVNLGTEDLFGYKIKYNTVEGESVPNLNFQNLIVQPKFNGNIAETDWKTSTDGNSNLRRYGYVYDKLNRLSAGFFQKDTNPTLGEYFERITYDINGNITTLQRTAGSNGTTANGIDFLVYKYAFDNQSNQLESIQDVSQNNSGYPFFPVRNNISYDTNGNMTNHMDKNISKIEYNHLNLPTLVNAVVGGGWLPGLDAEGPRHTYKYKANGTKYAKRVDNISPYMQEFTEVDYLDGFQYERKYTKMNTAQNPYDTGIVLKFAPTSEGYFDFEKNKYIYNYSDHLGNTRLSYFHNGSSIEVLEENNYYPFGLKHEGYNVVAGNPSYQYKYNGKELQETGFVSMDYRNYAPDIARFIGQDRLSEVMPDWTPYRFAFNNPVYFSDPTGLFEEGGNALAHCPTCPKTDEFKPYIDDKNNVYVYNSETNTASLKVTPIEEVVVTGKKSESNTNYHDWSQTLRKGSGYAFSANKMLFQPAFQSASQYGNPRPYTTTTLVFEKSLPKILGGRKIIYQPLMTMNAIKAGKISRGLKVTGRVLGVAGVGLAGYDMYENGVTTSNTLDLTMSALALSPTGVGQGIAAAYFLANGITILATGQDIGQHIDSSVGAYNDNVKAEEQQKFNEAMGY